MGQTKTLEDLQPYIASLPFKPHAWQLEDVAEGIKHQRFALFIPVGAGKTVIATLIALGWNDPVRIVLLPPILTYQWVKWLNSIPGAGKALAFQGSPKKRHDLPIEEYQWLVMSMDIFKRDHALLTDFYRGQEVTLIVDEAQSLKSAISDNFKKVNSFAQGRRLLLATGTELNSPGDAFAYIKLKTPLVYRSKAHFENLHVETRDFFEKPKTWHDFETITANLYKLATKRTKEEVHAHLPKATYMPLVYELDPEHKKLYNQLAEEMLLELPSGGKIDATTASALYNSLQQIILNWDHFAEAEGLRPAAWSLLDTMFDEISLGQKGASKVIIWTWFKRSTEATLAYCNKKFPGAFVAAYSGANSQKNVRRFLEDPTCLGLVAQPGSAGAGLNPQALCWEMLFLEAPTRSIPFKQAAGRVDREGQKYNATIRIAQAAGTIQEHLFRNLLTNDAEVMLIQNEPALRKAIYGG